jgi:hypothetical protein
MLNNDRMASLLARAMLVAAFLFGSTPMLMLVVDVPVVQAKPHGHGDSGSPDGCVPMGVTKRLIQDCLLRNSKIMPLTWSFASSPVKLHQVVSPGPE